MRPDYPLYDGLPPPAGRALRTTLALGRGALVLVAALVFHDFAHAVNPGAYATVSRAAQRMGGPVGALAASLESRRGFTDQADPFGSLVLR